MVSPIAALHFVDLTCARRVDFEILERHEAQPRPGTGLNGKRYNPKSAKIKKLRAHLTTLVHQFRPEDEPLFNGDMRLIIELKFYLPRPRIHMKKTAVSCSLRQPIRDAFNMAFVKRKTDVDNLSKFVVDAMIGGPLYKKDDSQE